MATRRRRNLLSSRKRVQDGGEEDDGVGDAVDDSQSEASELTVDDNLDADDSDASEAERQAEKPSDPSHADVNGTSKSRKKRKNTEAGQTVDDQPAETTKTVPAFGSTADMEAMVNGISAGDTKTDEEPVDFEDTTADSAAQVNPLASAPSARLAPRAKTNVAQRSVAEHQEYKAKRDADPAFVPNRGGFFMHDQRANGPNHTGTLSTRGRGRGRGFVANGQSQVRAPPPFVQGSAARWDHDLHDTVIEPKQTPSTGRPLVQNPHTTHNGGAQQHGSLSKSTPIGTVLVRVFLANMRAPLNIDKKLTVKQHTRLPDLRPPLRRDKPVRVSLPEHAVRYIFPSVERSFIFIPRAQRPNQQRTRSRNRGYHAGSRRTSVFGGSNYAQSVGMSRRSSQAWDGVASPAGSLYDRPPLGAPTGPSRPVVKLPSGPRSQQGVSPSSVAAVSGGGTPFISFPHGSAYPLPSQPTFREHRSSAMTMHQPRPQKQVSVATIESPDRGSFHAPQQQEQQPFHHQVPLQYGNQQPMDPSYYSQMGQMQIQSHPNGNTPLSNIPEGAINAQPFQPGLVAPQHGYYPYPFQQPMYYYAPTGQTVDGQGNQYAGSQVASPVYVQPGQYYMPMIMPVQASADDGAGGAQAGMYAHESNGAVYYYDPSQIADGGAAAGTTSQGAPADGGAMGAGPEGYFQQPGQEVFYYGQQ